MQGNEIIVLNSQEKMRLAELCGVVDRGIKTFFEVGMALAEIRDSRLYRETHETFEDFCRDKWDVSPRHANRYIAASYVVKNLGPIGPEHSSNTLTLPANEAQVRPLTEFDADTQRELWQRAVEYSIEVGTGRVTGAIVVAVVAEYLRKQVVKRVEKAKRESRETQVDETFNKSFAVFADTIASAINSRWKTVSKVAALKHLDELRALVAES